MSRRIIALAMFLVMVSLAAILVPATSAIRNNARSEARLELQREASMLASSLAPDEALIVANLAEVDNGEPHFVAIYLDDGRRVDGAGPAQADEATAMALRGSFADSHSAQGLVAAVPIPLVGGRFAALRVSEVYPDPAGAARRQLIPLLALAALIVLLGTGLAWLLARRLTRPLRDLQRAALSIDSGEMALQVPATKVRELDDLGRSLSTMVARIDQQIGRERAFAAQVSHQLKTPIAAMRIVMEAELAAPRADPSAAYRETVSAIDALDRTVADLLMLTRGQPDDRRSLHAISLVSAAGYRWNSQFKEAGRQLQLDADDVDVIASQAAIEHILDVLLNNSLHHGRGVTTLTCRARPNVRFEVADEAELNFDPFAVPARHGHGIGLKLARTLAEAEGAELTRAALLDGHRAIFTLAFPPSADVDRAMVANG